MSTQGFGKQSGKGSEVADEFMFKNAAKSNYQLKKEILMRKGYSEEEAHEEISRYWGKKRSNKRYKR